MDIITISPCSKRISNEAGKELNDCHIPSVSKSEIQNFLAVSRALNFDILYPVELFTSAV